MVQRFKGRKPATERSSITHERIISTITVMISLATILFSVMQYTYTQSLMDIRKYNHAYYDERYNVLKSLAHSISEIPVILINEGDLQSKEARETMLNAFVNFNYSLLVLDEGNKSDKVIIARVREYQKLLYELWSVNPNAPRKTFHPNTLRTANQLGVEIIQRCGKTLKNEKDSINSFNLRVWPFSFFGRQRAGTR